MFNDPAFQRDPYPTYQRLREDTPFLNVPEDGFIFISRYADVDALLRDRRLGRTLDHVISREARGLLRKPPHRASFDALGEHSLFDKEPPDHTRLRGLVHKAFTPRRVEQLRGQTTQIANALLDKVAQHATVDLLEAFAAPLPVTVIAELLGIPEEDRELLRPWSQHIVAMYELNPSAEIERRAVQAAAEFTAYLRDLFVHRRRHPHDDLISALVQVEEAGDRLSEDELVSTCVLLLNAGHEATVNGIGNGFYTLFQNPDQLARWRAHPELNASAVEELLRYDTPLQLFRRFVLQDFVYAGQTFHQGDELALLFGSANRDPAQFPNPDTLDIARRDNAHISFSAGIHFCLGAPLARLELNIAFGALLARFPNLALAAEPTFRPASVIRGLYALEVTLNG